VRRTGDGTVVNGEVASGRFSVFCFRQGRLVAVESLNKPADHVAARRVLATDDRPTAEQVAEPDFSLKAHVNQLAATAG
jgi:3-phenylpropionate/trans-cinnamate dioxygenase ferredoxin reductase component